jgi:glutamate/aspartate transport system substrate-binding protein
MSAPTSSRTSRRPAGKKLEVKFQPVTSQNRIPLVQNGTVDIECGSTTNNATRQKDVAFGVTTYVEETKIVVKANSGINSLADLKDKTVATTTGTTPLQTVRKQKRAENLTFKEGLRQGPLRQLPAARDRPCRRVRDGRFDPGSSRRQVEVAQGLQDPERRAGRGTHRHHDPQGRPRLQEGRGRQHQGTGQVGRAAKLYDKWFLKPIPRPMS